MKIKNITLLSIDEFCKYKKYIPPVAYEYWLRGPNPENNTACYIQDNSFYCDGHLAMHFGVRPALIVSGLKANRGDTIEIFNRKWVVLNSDLVFCCEVIFNYYFDDKTNIWSFSRLKMKLNNWFNEQLLGQEIFINIKNKTEWSFFQNLCKKYNIILEPEMTYEDFTNRSKKSNQIRYIPCKNSAYVFTTKQINSTMSFTEFCDYISENN